jgi:hypothetical protein
MNKDFTYKLTEIGAFTHKSVERGKYLHPELNGRPKNRAIQVTQNFDKGPKGNDGSPHQVEIFKSPGPSSTKPKKTN